jgi:hypothetical protein
MQAPPQLHELTKPNLEKQLNELFHVRTTCVGRCYVDIWLALQDGESLAITDPSLANVGVSVILSLQ